MTWSSALKPCAWPAEAAAARALNINAKLLYQWQQAAQQPLPAGGRRGTALRAQVRRQVQELATLKKAVAIFSQPPAP